MRRFLFGLAFTIGSVVLLFQVIDWRTSLSALRTANPWFVAAAVVCLLLSLGAKTFRWRFLLPAESGITTFRLYRILHISFLLNNVLPARLGDVARIAMTVRQPGLRVGHVLSSLLTERFADTVTLLACFVLVSPFLPVPAAYRAWVHVAWYVLAGLAGAGLAYLLLRRYVHRLARRLADSGSLNKVSIVRLEVGSFGEGVAQLGIGRRVAPIWGMSILAWLSAFAINYMVFQSLDISVPVTVAILVTCVTNLAMLIPSSPGYIGVFHIAATLALVPFGVDGSRALSFAIIAHLVNVIPVSVLGAIFMMSGREGVTINLRGSKPPEVDIAGAK